MAPLAMAHPIDALAPAPLIQEIFVFCEDAKNAEHQRQAAHFSVDAQTWAQHRGATAMIIEEMSDVPHETIAAVLPGRLLTRQQIFVKVQARRT